MSDDPSAAGAGKGRQKPLGALQGDLTLGKFMPMRSWTKLTPPPAGRLERTQADLGQSTTTKYLLSLYLLPERGRERFGRDKGIAARTIDANPEAEAEKRERLLIGARIGGFLDDASGIQKFCFAEFRPDQLETSDGKASVTNGDGLSEGGMAGVVDGNGIHGLQHLGFEEAHVPLGRDIEGHALKSG